MNSEYPKERGSNAAFSKAATGVKEYINWAMTAVRMLLVRLYTMKKRTILRTASKKGETNP
jgi:hypothetical protein